MLGIGAIEIESADYCLGMCGSIVFRINADGSRYKISHNMQDGMLLAKWQRDTQSWTAQRRVKWNDVDEILPKAHGWTEQAFIAVWAGFSAGYERGVNERKG
jgi:hypothetical protein